MYNIGDTFIPNGHYAKFLGLNTGDIFTIYKKEGGKVYWNGPGLERYGGDGCQENSLLMHLIPYNISLENK